MRSVRIDFLELFQGLEFLNLAAHSSVSDGFLHGARNLARGMHDGIV